MKSSEMTTFGERLRAERVRLRHNQTAFGDLGGVGKVAQINYEAGKRAPDAAYLSAIAEQGVDVLYVLTGRRDPMHSTDRVLVDLQEILSDPEDFAAIPRYAATLGAGAGRDNSNELVLGHMAFRRDWLRRMGISPVSAAVARAEGDSMMPTIFHGDDLLVDMARNTPPTRVRGPRDTRAAPIYALRDGTEDLARVKRIELVGEGRLALVSDNPAYPIELVAPDQVAIIGRVMCASRTLAD